MHHCNVSEFCQQGTVYPGTRVFGGWNAMLIIRAATNIQFTICSVALVTYRKTGNVLHTMIHGNRDF